MQPITTPALILRRIPYGEADQIVTFFGRAEGRFSGLAKSAKRSQRRFGGALEPGSIVELRYVHRPGAALVRLDDAKVITPTLGLLRSLSRIAATTTAVELALAFLKEGDANIAKFDVLTTYLLRIAQQEPTVEDEVRFVFRWFSLCGYAPVVDHCVTCQEVVTHAAGWSFSPLLSGVLCPSCGEGANDGMALPGEETWEAWRIVAGRYAECVLGHSLKSWETGVVWNTGSVL